MSKDTGWRTRDARRREDEPPPPEPSEEQIRAVIARHRLGVDLADVTRLRSIGTVNTALGLGARFVLRVPKLLGVRETQTESVAAPVAKAAGIRTPALLVYDDSREIFEVPYTIYERVAGENFGLSDLRAEVSAAVYREIGTQLAVLHERVTSCSDPHGYLATPSRPDPDDLVEHLGSESLLSAYNVEWLRRVLDRLRPAVVAARRLRRFLHNDVLPTNMIVRDGALAALIDWNDSGWGDPALEFVSLPGRALPYILEGYRQIRALDDEETAPHRMLWDHLCQALEFLIAPVNKDNISWARPPFARVMEMVSTAASYPPWQALLR